MPQALASNKLAAVSEATMSEMLARYWYYSIELKPGVVTPGAGHLNVGLTRRILERVDCSGKRCVDIGAMEGLISTLLTRRGGSVTAIDAVDDGEKVRLVQAAQDVKFRYCPNIASMDIVDRLSQIHALDFSASHVFRAGVDEQPAPMYFDLAVCSGVMYHVWSPLHLIGTLRTLVRPGGLVVLETAAIHSDKASMQFNYDGHKYRYSHWSNTWFLTDTLLDHMLRMFRLQPLDCIYMGNATGNDPVIRLAVVCRAVDSVLAQSHEEQMVPMTKTYEFSSMLRRVGAPGLTTGDVGFAPLTAARVMRQETHSCDLHATVAQARSQNVSPGDVVLRLGDLA